MLARCKFVSSHHLHAGFPSRVTRGYKIAIQYDTIRNSVWQSRLAYVLQRFVGTNFLRNACLFDNLRSCLPGNT